MTEERVFPIMLDTMFETRRNKRYGRDSSQFEKDWAPLLVRMMWRLMERTFRVDHNYAFLTSTPKWREIFATTFEGRVADHLLCDTLMPYIEKELHPRTFNNRKGMGSQAAINRVIEDIYEVSEGDTVSCRIIKWDLKGFFPNADCNRIEAYFCGVIERNRDDLTERFNAEMPNFLKWLAMICIHCKPAHHCELRSPRHMWDEHITKEKSLFGKADGIGTPIERLTSQMGMGLYLNDEVCWLNEECGIRSTLFMDDCVMVVAERLHQYALSLFPVLRSRLLEKGVSMNEKKFYDQPHRHGLEFLGSHIKPHRIHLNNGTYRRAVERVDSLNGNDEKLRYLDIFLSSVNSYIGLLKARTDRKRLVALRDMIGEEWWGYLGWNNERLCLGYREGYSINDRLNRKYNLKLKHYGTRDKKRKTFTEAQP